MCGNVCNHCYLGTGAVDACRTCKAKEERAQTLGHGSVRPLQRADALEILAMQFKGRRR